MQDDRLFHDMQKGVNLTVNTVHVIHTLRHNVMHGKIRA